MQNTGVLMVALVVGFYFLFFPAPVVLVSSLLYLCALRFRGRRVTIPFSWLDAVVPAISLIFWCLIDEYVLTDHKRMGNMLEILGLGGLFSLLFVLRLYVLYCRPGLKSRVVLVASAVVFVSAVVMALFVPPTME